MTTPETPSKRTLYSIRLDLGDDCPAKSLTQIRAAALKLVGTVIPGGWRVRKIVRVIPLSGPNGCGQVFLEAEREDA